MNKELTLYVGPPGSGKSTAALQDLGCNPFNTVYINQDSQGKEGHQKLFLEAIQNGQNIICDRMNFSKEQRNRYLLPAKEAGYRTTIVVLHESFETCFKRCLERQNHETIKTQRDASQALHFFFKKYERVEDNEADGVIRIWPKGEKPYAIICDLDGTLCNIDHRLDFVRGEGKKNWKGFFDGIPGDKVNEWCRHILQQCAPREGVFYKLGSIKTILCSGRPDSHRKQTESWLEKHGVGYDNLFMRSRDDFRNDSVVKEQIMEFELKTRYNIYFWLDDRKQVVDKIRSHGIVVLQVAPGDF